MATAVHVVRAGVLDIAYECSGPGNGWPVVLSHGFPYDPRCFDDVVVRLTAAGARVVVPYLRGYGPTRFVAAATPRSGQQAALAHDLHELIVALKLEHPIVGGYDWGGRASCLVSMLWPESVSGLVSVGGYNVQDIARSGQPASPATESRLWYQYYLHGERGRTGLGAYRRAYARQLWREWSPTWSFTDDVFDASAPSFDNPDFVDVVVHSYRHRYGLVDGDPVYDESEARIAAQPPIEVATIVIDPTRDGIADAHDRAHHQQHFSALLDHRPVATGHNPAQEDPESFADAVRDVHDQTWRR